MCVNEIPTSHFTIYTILIHFHNPDIKINLCNTDYPEDLCSQMLINLPIPVFIFSQRARINYINVLIALTYSSLMTLIHFQVSLKASAVNV